MLHGAAERGERCDTSVDQGLAGTAYEGDAFDDPETYLGAARLLDVAPARLTLVAAHPDDLRAAARCGLGTALVLRPDEMGVGRGLPAYQDGEFDVVVDGFGALADQWRA